MSTPKADLTLEEKTGKTVIDQVSMALIEVDRQVAITALMSRGISSDPIRHQDMAFPTVFRSASAGSTMTRTGAKAGSWNGRIWMTAAGILGVQIVDRDGGGVVTPRLPRRGPPEAEERDEPCIIWQPRACSQVR